MGAWVSIIELVIKFLPGLIKFIVDLIAGIKKPDVAAFAANASPNDLACRVIDVMACELAKAKDTLTAANLAKTANPEA